MNRILFSVITLVIALSATTSYAQQASTPKWKGAASLYYARDHDCWDRYNKHLIGTFTEATNCADQGAAAALEAAGYPAMDLARYLFAEHAAIAERVDGKKITPAEGFSQRAALDVRIKTEIERRSAVQAQTRANIEAAHAAELNAQTKSQSDQQSQQIQLDAMRQLQAQQAADADAARRLQALEIARRLLAPTYVGPAQSSAPIITNCQWLGQFGQCLTQ